MKLYRAMCDLTDPADSNVFSYGQPVLAKRTFHRSDDWGFWIILSKSGGFHQRFFPPGVLVEWE